METRNRQRRPGRTNGNQEQLTETKNKAEGARKERRKTKTGKGDHEGPTETRNEERKPATLTENSKDPWRPGRTDGNQEEAKETTKDRR